MVHRGHPGDRHLHRLLPGREEADLMLLLAGVIAMHNWGLHDKVLGCYQKKPLTPIGSQLPQHLRPYRCPQ